MLSRQYGNSYLAFQHYHCLKVQGLCWSAIFTWVFLPYSQVFSTYPQLPVMKTVLWQVMKTSYFFRHFYLKIIAPWDTIQNMKELYMLGCAASGPGSAFFCGRVFSSFAFLLDIKCRMVSLEAFVSLCPGFSWNQIYFFHNSWYGAGTKMWITCQCCNCCWVVLTASQGHFSFSNCPARKWGGCTRS